MNQTTPKGMRLHIGIFGRRNVGKSSILNALCGQQISIVSHHAGTTTDPVEKPMELLPLGPVVFIDTAGIDDCGALGALRNKKTRSCLDRVDLADGDGGRDAFDPFDLGPVQPLQKLAGIGGEALHVAALPFGVQGVKREAGFTRPADPGHHGQLVQGDLEVQVFQVVLASAPYTYDRLVHVVGPRVFGLTLGRKP